MIPFQWRPKTRIVAGPDSVTSVGELTREAGASRVLLVSDVGVVAAGHVERAMRELNRNQIDSQLFDQVHANPTEENVDAGTAFAREFRPDLLIGMGGGSAMDAAKGINFLLTNGGRMEDYWGYGKASKPMLPMFAIPTTAGTGSEVQSYALISRTDNHYKMACGDPQAVPSIAILDPTLLPTAPQQVAILAAIDALSHSIESFVTTASNVISNMFSREAFRLMANNICGLHDANQSHGGLAEVWSAMQWGACLAGLAIEHSMLGAAHALANPLTADCAIPHGHAVGIMLPHVIRFNREFVAGYYTELQGLLTASTNGLSLDHWFSRILEEQGIATRLSACGVLAEQLPSLAEGAIAQWTARFNPRPLSLDDAIQLYRNAI